MIIGIDASRANLEQKTGTEWYSYFLIEELKRLANHISFSHMGEGAPPTGGADEVGGMFNKKNISHKTNLKFILYSRSALAGDLGKLPVNFQSRILKWPLILLWTQIRLSYETFVNPPDVLFIPAHTIPIIGRAKTVMTVHDIGFRVYPELYSWIDIFYHRFSIWWASRFAWKIICPSEFTKRELIKYYKTDPGKIRVIPHGIKIESRSVPPPANRLTAQAGWRAGIYRQNPNSPINGHTTGNQKNYLLYVGRLEKKKNILGILRAFKIVLGKRPGMKLILAGRPGYDYGRILELIQELNLEESVEIRGYVAEEEKTKLYKNALAFVFPTFYEGFGMPILEAQSYGCPVITSSRGANAEVAGDSAVLVDPDLAEEIADGVSKLLDNESFRREIVNKGYENLKRFSWWKAAESVYRILSG